MRFLLLCLLLSACNDFRSEGIERGQAELPPQAKTPLYTKEQLEQREAWLRLALDKGDMDAAYQLGMLLCCEPNLPSRFEEAEPLLCLTYQQGNPDAPLGLSDLYIRQNTSKSIAKAYAYTEIARQRGDVRANEARRILHKNLSTTDISNGIMLTLDPSKLTCTPYVKPLIKQKPNVTAKRKKAPKKAPIAKTHPKKIPKPVIKPKMRKE